jgi:hypothetical protein
MEKTMWLIAWSLLLSDTAPASTAVIALDNSPEVEAVVAAVAKLRAAAGDTPATQTALKTALTGGPTPRDADEDALRCMLMDAREYEGRFETPKANELRRQILHTFENAVRPSRALRLLAGEAGLDIAAGLLSDGDKEGATRVAREIFRRFPMSVDTTYRDPNTVDFLKAQQRVVEAGTRTRVTIRSNRAGAVYSDGILLGKTDGVLVTALSPGRNRLWLEWPGGSSLPHVVNVAADPVGVLIDTELDERLRLEPVVQLACDEDCASLMAALGARLGLRRVVGVRAAEASTATGDQPAFRVLDVETETGTARISFVGANGMAIAVDSTPQRRRAIFRPLYLVPFGVGQFTQDRPVAGAVYATAETGLLAWYVVNWRRHAEAASRDDIENASHLRRQRDLAAVLFFSSLAAAVAESVIVGWLSGE